MFDWHNAFRTLVFISIPATLLFAIIAKAENEHTLGTVLFVAFFVSVFIGGGIF